VRAGHRGAPGKNRRYPTNDPVFLDVGLARRRAHDRSDHVLPIGTKRDMPDPDHFALARPLEGQDVVAASDPFRRIWVELLLAAVEAGLDDFLHAASGQEIS